MLIPSSKQVDIFSDDQRQLHFAELCNALYERELANLSQQKISNISLLQRKLGGLKHHIKRAADSLLQKESPLQIDIHNASWQGKQAAKCMADKADPDKTEQWFIDNSQLGRCIAIHVDTLGAEHIELDSIDRIDRENAKLHANKFGWFAFDGTFVEDSIRQADVLNLKLLKPNKTVFTAACCGHNWNHKGKSQPKALSLRELMLSLSINWKTFK
ncbi:hypothetical protein RS130_09770 [Paraglaciecola aquimarina]|uniref:Uncharacterized protein n=1 Tax=Paraglaciecola aquimarina TaxID=1235557 RepID=A0ABU3SVY4_9ALTE|nr:hypothetical protein [Paraglaciecola aquimarina]MDU0354180.1 hypothetical protein [Paraglaciecola aquimarina]